MIGGAIFRQSDYTLKDAIYDLEGRAVPEIDHTPIWETGIKYDRISALSPGQNVPESKRFQIPFSLVERQIKKSNRLVMPFHLY